MKKIYSFIFSFLIGMVISTAQPTTAWDFTMNDCNGNMHHLFSELDSGDVAIIEFFMLSCSPCVDAANELEPMYQNLKATCSSKIRFYHFGYTNSYTCAQITNWVSTNGFSSVPFDSGAVQTAYYQGMGMPTLAVVAGNTHKVLHTSVGYNAGDTAMIADSIRTFFGCVLAGIADNSSLSSSVSVYPNPTTGQFKIQSADIKIQNVEIYTPLGEKIYSAIFNCTSPIINIDVPDGIYFLTGEADGKRFSKKISITR